MRKHLSKEQRRWAREFIGRQTPHIARKLRKALKRRTGWDEDDDC